MYRIGGEKSKWLGMAVYFGIDLHRLAWYVTVRTTEIEIFSGSIPGRWEALVQLLERYRGAKIQAVYEAGYFGFWLYDRLEEYGVACIVTPVPRQNPIRQQHSESGSLSLL